MGSDRLLHSTMNPPPNARKRPIGAMILAIILLLSGLFIGGERVFVLLKVFSTADNVVIDPSFYPALLRTGITSISAIIAAVGLLVGSRFGWWFATAHVAFRISTQVVLPLLGLLAGHANIALLATLIAPFVIFGGLLLYLMRGNVKAYYSILAGSVSVAAALLISTFLLAFALDIWQTAVAS